MKKANTILAAIVFFLFFVAMQATCHSQTIVRIDSVKWVGNWKADITGRNEKGEKCYVYFGMTPKQKNYVRVGNYLLVSTGRFGRPRITQYKPKDI